MLLALIDLGKLRIISTLAILYIWCILKEFRWKWWENHILNRSIPPITVRSEEFLSRFLSDQRPLLRPPQPQLSTLRLKMLLPNLKEFFLLVFSQKSHFLSVIPVIQQLLY